MNRLRVFIPVVSSFILVVSLMVACGGGTKTTPPATTAKPATTAPATTAPATSKPATTAPATTAAPTSAFKMPDTVRVMAGGTGGTQYILGTAIAPTLEKYLKIPVRVMPLEVIRERFVFFKDLKVDIGVESFSNQAQAMEGFDAFAADGPQEMRQMWYIFDAPCGYIVRADSDIKVPADIKGKRVAWPVFSSSMAAGTNALIEMAGLKKEDVTMVPCSDITALYKSVGEMKSDISFAVLTSSATFEVEAMPHGVRVIPINDKDFLTFLKYTPISLHKVLGYEGIKSSQGVWGATSLYGIMAHSIVPDELVYQVTKILWEKFDEYKGVQSYLKYGTQQAQKDFIKTMAMPYHPGTIKFFKEIGVWTAADDTSNYQCLAKEKLFQSAWETALTTAKAKNIKVDTTNKDWMALWDSQRIQVPQYKTKVQ